MRTNMLRKILIASACVLLIVGCSKPPAPAAAKAGTVAVVNARVWTGDDAQPWAQALVIDGATLAMVGTNEDARKANAEQVIDAGGRLIVPGFTDAHVHFREGGFGLASVQLRDAATRAREIWCIFDNTALGAAAPNALGLLARLSSG